MNLIHGRSFLNKQNRLAIVSFCLASIVLCFRVWQINQPDILFDDAFISFRYARNLATGFGLVYNLNERVEGYTNFLWTIVLAAILFFQLNPIALSKLLLLISTFIILMLMLSFGKKAAIPEGSAPLGFALLLYAVMGCQSRFIVSGMETLFFTMFLFASLYSFLFSPQSTVTGVLFALTAMTRPEGILYFLIALIYAVSQTLNRGAFKLNEHAHTLFGQEKPSVGHIFRLLGSFFLVYGLYFAWRYHYYGDLLPNTFYAKVAGSWIGNFHSGIGALASLMKDWALLPLFLIPLTLIPKIKQGNLVFLFTTIFITLIYFVVIGGDFIVWFGPRLLMPVFPILALLNEKGLTQILQWAKKQKIRWFHGGALLLFPLLLFYEYQYSWPGFMNMKNFTTQMRGWAELGLWIADHTPENASLASDAAGLIPYYSNRYTIDMFGLTDRHIAHLKIKGQGYGVVGHEKVDPLYILQRSRPTCIVSTWLSPEGEAIAAGLDGIKDQFNKAYILTAVAKVRMGPPQDGTWVVETQSYNYTLYENGYWTGIFCLRDGFQ